MTVTSFGNVGQWEVIKMEKCMKAHVITSEGGYEINNIDGVRRINSNGDVTKFEPRDFADFKFYRDGHYIFIGDKIVSSSGEIIKVVIFF